MRIITPTGNFVQKSGDTMTGQLTISAAVDPPLIIDRAGLAVGEIIRLRTNTVTRGQIAGNSVEPLIRGRDGGGVDRWGFDLALGKLITGIIPLARMQVTEQFAENAALVTIGVATTTIVDLAQITVSAGDRIFITASIIATKGAIAGRLTLEVIQALGTGNVVFYNNYGTTKMFEDVAANAVQQWNLAGIGRATVGGTVTFRLQGVSAGSDSTVAIGSGKLYALALQGT